MRDHIAKTIVTIDHAHHMIHDGYMFTAGIYDGTLGNGETLIMATKTGALCPHVYLEWGANGAAHLDLIEGGTWDAGSGDLVAVANENRNSTKVTTMQEDKTANPLFTATGYVLKNVTNLAGDVGWFDYIFGPKNAPGRNRNDSEFVLLPNTTYAMRMTSDAVGNSGYMRITWYEEEECSCNDE